jgi:hypothetical protein
MKDKYEVGYGKPPKASRFGARPQPNRSSKSGLAREAAISVAAAINRPMKVTKRGATVRMHPHEAQMHGLAKNGLLGKLRAMREFYLECKKAGLLDAPPARQTSGVITVPKGVPTELAARLVRIAGPPPWDDNLYDQCMAEYERDCENIERLEEEAKARADAEKAHCSHRGQAMQSYDARIANFEDSIDGRERPSRSCTADKLVKIAN